MENETNESLQVPPMVVVETERLRLRTVRLDDLDDILPLIANLDVMKWTSCKPIADRQQAKRWLSDRALGRDTFNFAIELRQKSNPPSSPTVIGLIGAFHWPSCGYMLDSSHFGKGYATEALKALIPFLFERMASIKHDGHSLEYIEGRTDAENWGSRRVLEKSGFSFCGVVEKDFNSPHFGLRDTAYYRIPVPGKSLEQLGLASAKKTEESDRDGQPQPPIQ